MSGPGAHATLQEGQDKRHHRRAMQHHRSCLVSLRETGSQGEELRLKSGEQKHSRSSGGGSRQEGTWKRLLKCSSHIVRRGGIPILFCHFLILK